MAVAKQKRHSRPGRSNSLQRMLELEKQCMLDRRNVQNGDLAAAIPPHASFPSEKTANNTTPTGPASSPSHSFVSQQDQPRHAIPRRQLPAESLLAPRDPNCQAKGPREKHAAPLQPRQHQSKMQQLYELPPIITTGTDSLAAGIFGASPASPYPNRKDDHRVAAKGDAAAPSMDVADVATPTKPSATSGLNRTVSPRLEDRRSVCQSPSWEAYGRRKKERKEEKKEKELADKETKAKKSRLSKLPPSLPQPTSAPTPREQKDGSRPPKSQKGLALSETDSCVSDSPRPRPRQKNVRPASMVALSSTDLPLPGDIPASQKPRSRSGSFSSLFKAPFEIRRPSFDHSSDTGFIGGIKLEQRRLAAHQKALDDCAIGPEADIHPALRKTEKRSQSPLRVFTARSEAKDSQKRDYPPIAMQTSGKNQALLAPETAAMSETGTMNRWRERMGFKASAQKNSTWDWKNENTKGQSGQKLTKSPAQRDASIGRVAAGKNNSTPAISSPIMVNAMTADEKEVMINSVDIDHSAHPAFAAEAGGEPHIPSYGKDKHVGSEEAVNLGSETNSQPSFKTAPSSPPPPPRRSSKRRSLMNMPDTNASSPTEAPPLRTESQESGKKSSADIMQHTEPVSKTSSEPAVVVHQEATGENSSASKTRPNRWTMSDPPSIPYDAVTSSSVNGLSNSPKRTLREAAKAAFGRGGLSPTPIPASGVPMSRSRSPYPRGIGKHDDSRSESATDAHNVRTTTSPVSKPARILGIQDWNIGRPTTTSPAAHSSEDSCSDDFRFPSASGTPNTSRPQSVKGVFPTGADNEHCEKLDQNTHHRSGYTSVLPSPAFSHADSVRQSNQPSPIELDPIHAAALKVMAAFPDVPVSRYDADRRNSSGSHITANTAILPAGKQQIPRKDKSRPKPIKTDIEPVPDTEPKSPTLRDLIMSNDQSPVAAPWPASYLEAARKAAPAALAPKGSLPTAAPSTNLSPPALRSQQSSPSNSEPVFKADGHGSSSGAADVQDSDAIAKMFVECCGCKYYHDMPSKLYEAMANPDGVVTMGDNMEFAGSVSMTVKCPWCKHEMSTKCCAGLAALVYVKERLH